MRWVLLSLAGLLLAAGCGDEPRLGGPWTPPPDPEYLANDSPDNLMANLVMAWEAEDAEGYAALLYDGVELATDSLNYASYKFYYDRSQNPDLPEVDLYERELVRIGNMLDGLPGQDSQGNPVPGIKSISMELSPIGSWADVSGGEANGDSCPEDTRWRAYETQFLFTLKSNYGANTSAWLVQDRLIAHCMPVQVGGGTEWRLWKWRDILSLAGRVPVPSSTEESSLSGIKALY